MALRLDVPLAPVFSFMQRVECSVGEFRVSETSCVKCPIGSFSPTRDGVYVCPCTLAKCILSRPTSTVLLPRACAHLSVCTHLLCRLQVSHVPGRRQLLRGQQHHRQSGLLAGRGVHVLPLLISRRLLSVGRLCQGRQLVVPDRSRPQLTVVLCVFRGQDALVCVSTSWLHHLAAYQAPQSYLCALLNTLPITREHASSSVVVVLLLLLLLLLPRLLPCPG